MNKGVRTALSVAAAIAGAIGLFVVGLFVYVNATARPIHPESNAIPSATGATPPAEWNDAVSRARQTIRSGITSQNLPALSIAVGSGGAVVWTEALGYADLDTKQTVTPETRFRIGDVSVPLTSAAAGLLVEKHALNLDADIQLYVPEFPEKSWPVTVRQLMAHTAGVRADAGDEEPLGERCDRTVDGLKRFANDRLVFEPDTRVHVSSYGWVLVSAAIEAAAREPFFAFMRSQVFEPLHMDDTLPYIASQSIPHLPTFYFPRFGGDTRLGPELARDGDQSCFAGAGAFLSTPSDLARFGMAFNSGTLLKPETARLLETAQRLSSGDATGYGLGWKLETLDTAGGPLRVAGYNSKPDFIGGTTSLVTIPERGLAVAIASNTSFADTWSLALEVARAFAEQPRRP
jgi:CubicO group peptidase (beta-lactamase class C family)